MLTKAAKPDKNHLAYVGIVAPVDNAFWNTRYPPNRWRCQCGVEQTDEPTTDIPSNLPQYLLNLVLIVERVNKYLM